METWMEIITEPIIVTLMEIIMVLWMEIWMAKI